MNGAVGPFNTCLHFSLRAVCARSRDKDEGLLYMLKQDDNTWAALQVAGTLGPATQALLSAGCRRTYIKLTGPDASP